MNGSVLCLAPTGDRCGEGVLWHPDEEAVYWTDINRFLVHRFTLSDGCVRTCFFDEPVTSVLLTDQEGVLALVLGSGLILWQSEQDKRTAYRFRLHEWPRVRCNDAAVDVNGSIWLGTMRNNVGVDGSETEAGGTDGVLYRVDPDGSVSEWQSGLGIANTVVWSPDQKIFYFADSLKNAIDAYNFSSEPLGTIANRRAYFYDFERGLPDGSAVDSEGYVWNCRYGGSCIARIAPDGQLAQVLEMPTKNITNCTFGGPGLRTLFVTTASSDDRLAGSLFASEMGVAGLPDNRFRVTL